MIEVGFFYSDDEKSEYDYENESDNENEETDENEENSFRVFSQVPRKTPTFYNGIQKVPKMSSVTEMKSKKNESEFHRDLKLYQLKKLQGKVQHQFFVFFPLDYYVNIKKSSALAYIPEHELILVAREEVAEVLFIHARTHKLIYSKPCLDYVFTIFYEPHVKIVYFGGRCQYIEAYKISEKKILAATKNFDVEGNNQVTGVITYYGKERIAYAGNLGCVYIRQAYTLDLLEKIDFQWNIYDLISFNKDFLVIGTSDESKFFQIYKKKEKKILDDYSPAYKIDSSLFRAQNVPENRVCCLNAKGNLVYMTIGSEGTIADTEYDEKIWAKCSQVKNSAYLILIHLNKSVCLAEIKTDGKGIKLLKENLDCKLYDNIYFVKRNKTFVGNDQEGNVYVYKFKFLNINDTD